LKKTHKYSQVIPSQFQCTKGNQKLFWGKGTCQTAAAPIETNQRPAKGQIGLLNQNDSLPKGRLIFRGKTAFCQRADAPIETNQRPAKRQIGLQKQNNSLPTSWFYY